MGVSLMAALPYADDITIRCTSQRALLYNNCEHTNYIIFNTKKTVCVK